MSVPLWGDGVCEYVLDDWQECWEYDYVGDGFTHDCDSYIDYVGVPLRSWFRCSQPARYVHTYGIVWTASFEEQPCRVWRRLCAQHCEDDRLRHSLSVQPMFDCSEYPKTRDHVWQTLDEEDPPAEVKEQAELQRAYFRQRCRA